MISHYIIIATFFTPFVFAQLGEKCLVNRNSSSYYFIPHPTNCSKFFSCDNGIYNEMECPARLHFNALRKICDWPSLAGCTINNGLEIEINEAEEVIMGQPCHPSDIRSSPRVAPFNGNCEKFLICAGVWTLMNCPKGLLFSVETGHCEFPKNAKCCPTCSIELQKCSKEGTRLSSPIDCHKFFFCHNGTLIESNCDEGTIFSAVKGECINGTSCESLTTPTNALPFCAIEGSLYPNFQNCKKFYICNGKTIVDQSCPPNKFFSVKHNNCQYKPNAVCVTDLKTAQKQSKKSMA